MNDVPALLEALASLLWPLLILVVLVRFSPAVAAIIESARSRKFTLKVGGQELSMEEVREQQSTLIADLQSRVADLMARTESAGAGGGGGAPSGRSAPAGATLELVPPRGAAGPDRDPRGDASVQARTAAGPPRVLWVDDQPRNNGLVIERLSRGGVEVDLALSTRDGLGKVARSDYRLVLSDVGREEDGGYNADAGLELIQAVKRDRPDVPVALFTTSAGVRHRGAEARKLGADLVTSSATDLVRFLSTHLPEWQG